MPEFSYVSKEQLEKLKVELEELKTNKRIEIAERLKVAKEAGDLSENSEYFEAREDQARVEARIFELEELIKKSVIIGKAKAGGFVRIGSTVLVQKGGTTKRFTIVGSMETNPEGGFISNESPLGKAFLGAKIGDDVVLDTPGGKSTYKVLDIE